MNKEIIPPDCLNASEFMWHVTMNTPRILQDVKGIVNVAARLRIDAEGRVAIKSVCCNTMTGKPVATDNAEIIAAAREALAVLRFAPAHDEGVAVTYEDYPLSFGYTTAALEMRASKADQVRSRSMRN